MATQDQQASSRAKLIHKLGHLLGGSRPTVLMSPRQIPSVKTAAIPAPESVGGDSRSKLITKPGYQLYVPSDEMVDQSTTGTSDPPMTPSDSTQSSTNRTGGRLRLIRKLDQLLNLTPVEAPFLRGRPCKRLSDDSTHRSLKSPRNSSDPPAFYSMAANQFDSAENRPPVSQSYPLESKSESDGVKTSKYSPKSLLGNRKLTSIVSGAVIRLTEVDTPTKHVQFDDDDLISPGSDQQSNTILTLEDQTRSATMDHMYTPECRRQLLTAELGQGNPVQRAESFNLHLTELLDRQRRELSERDKRIANLVLHRSRQNATIEKLSEEVKYFKTCFVAAARYTGGEVIGGVAAEEISVPELLIQSQERIGELENEREQSLNAISVLTNQLAESKAGLTTAREQFARSQQEEAESTKKQLDSYRDKIKAQEAQLKIKNLAVRKLAQRVIASKMDAAKVEQRPEPDESVADEKAMLPEVYYVLVDPEQLQAVQAAQSGNDEAVEMWLQPAEPQEAVAAPVVNEAANKQDVDSVRRSSRQRRGVKKFADELSA